MSAAQLTPLPTIVQQDVPFATIEEVVDAVRLEDHHSAGVSVPEAEWVFDQIQMALTQQDQAAEQHLEALEVAASSRDEMKGSSDAPGSKGPPRGK